MTARPTPRVAALAAVLAALFFTTACPKKPVPPPPEPTPVEEPPPPPPPVKEVEPEPEITKPAPEPVESSDLDEMIRRQNETRGILKTVYFQFDEYDLQPDAIATLKANADWIKKNTRYRVVVEGHCDERGTIEYNLELGAKRAKAVVDYLANLGVDAGRLRTISYGEERPANPGHDEAAWSKNRRAEFTLEK